MNTWKVILATLVIFGAGVATGCLLMSQAHRKTTATLATTGTNSSANASSEVKVSHPSPIGALPGIRKSFLKDLDQELQLTAIQREHIEKILFEGQERTSQVWCQIAPQMQEEWCSVKNAIRKELTDEQRAKFEEFMKRPRKSQQPKSETPSANPDAPSQPAGSPSANCPSTMQDPWWLFTPESCCASKNG